MKSKNPINIAIACGGTGGHLFPGLAVAEQLRERGCAVTLIVSNKDVDQQAVRNVSGMEIITLPAVGLRRGAALAFVRGFWRSYRKTKEIFRSKPPAAVLAMGGFTSAPPVLAGRRLGARAFLHESNSIPGRANRWLSRTANEAFVGFESAARRLSRCRVSVTGTPVRPEFQPGDRAACRSKLGLQPGQPVLLVMGGSQGAGGVNELVVQSLPLFAREKADWQWFHITGTAQEEKVRAAYAALGLKAIVHPFFADMALPMGAADAAVSRAGASSLAELAAMRLPAVLIPFPAATENHQFHNAHIFALTGAARLLEQKTATPEALLSGLVDFMDDTIVRDRARMALGQWHAPEAAGRIAGSILAEVEASGRPAVVSKARSLGTAGYKTALQTRSIL